MLLHTLTRFAGRVLVEDLQDSGGGPVPMRSIYIEEFAGASPGHAAPLEPYHWMLALVAAPEIKLILDRSEEGQE